MFYRRWQPRLSFVFSTGRKRGQDFFRPIERKLREKLEKSQESVRVIFAVLFWQQDEAQFFRVPFAFEREIFAKEKICIEFRRILKIESLRDFEILFK